MEKLKLLSKPNNVSLCKDIRNLACVSEAHCTQKPGSSSISPKLHFKEFFHAEENMTKNVAFKENRKRKISEIFIDLFKVFKIF